MKIIKKIKKSISSIYKKAKSSDEVHFVKTFAQKIADSYEDVRKDYYLSKIQKRSVNAFAAYTELPASTYEYIDEEYVNNLKEEEREKVIQELQHFPVKMTLHEYMRYQKFCEEHNNCSSTKDIELCVGTSSGIGISYVATCHTCKTKCDITDYGCW